jgi:uncharacterized membrane protein
VAVLVACSSQTDTSQTGTSSGNGTASAALTDADLVIPVADVTDDPTFYPVTVDGESMEVLALRAADGSVRTAFNTCQVCYDSGRGYYQWSGTALVCQNCGNQFAPDQVEVVSGGCNPVPIFDADVSDDGTNITIPLSYLQSAQELFANWKQ